MKLNEITERCPEIIIEMIRFIPNIQGMDLLSLMLINKKWFNLIDLNQLLYKLLIEDRLQKDNFTQLINNNNIIDYKEIFINNVLNYWTEYLQKIHLDQISINNELQNNVIVKCQGYKFWLERNNFTINNNQIKNCFRNVKSKSPIIKDTEIYFYIKSLNNLIIDHSEGCYLSIGIINELIFNENQQQHHQNNSSFETYYTSAGHMRGILGEELFFNCKRFYWKKGDVISIKVNGIIEQQIIISYYLNDELMYEIKNVLDGVDVINVKENGLYFNAKIFQTENNLDNTMIVASFTKPSDEELGLSTFTLDLWSNIEFKKAKQKKTKRNNNKRNKQKTEIN